MSDEERLARRAGRPQPHVFEVRVGGPGGGFSCQDAVSLIVGASGVALLTAKGDQVGPAVVRAMIRQLAPAVLVSRGTPLVMVAGMADCSPGAELLRAGRYGFVLAMLQDGFELQENGGEDGMHQGASSFARIGPDGVVHGRKCDGPDGWSRLPGASWLHVAVDAS